MIKQISVAAASLFLCMGLAQAADAKPADAAPTAQQTKMGTCNADAKEKKLEGADRKAFMKTCLSAKKVSPQQEKMKACNVDAKAKKLAGPARKEFMSTCLKG